MTEVFDKMCEDKILICLDVKLPPAKDELSMYHNQDGLKVDIAKFVKYLCKSIVCIFTSSCELGSVSETTAYVRFLYKLGDAALALCGFLSQVQVGTHTLHAIICFK